MICVSADNNSTAFLGMFELKKLKDKEKVMIDAIDGQLLVPEYTDDYLQEVKDIIMGRYK